MGAYTGYYRAFGEGTASETGRQIVREIVGYLREHPEIMPKIKRIAWERFGVHILGGIKAVLTFLGQYALIICGVVLLAGIILFALWNL